MKDEFYFPSKDGNTEIHTIEWKPEGEVKAVLQIVHGMVEYINRYEEFAEYLCSQGIYVVGNDHLGHGKSVQSKCEYGFFHKKYGNACVMSDIHALHQRTAKKYPGVPYFMLGHSMGSMLLRQYIQIYGEGLSGALFIGVVAERPPILLWMGKRICRIIALVKGWHYRSKLVDNLVVGSFNKKYKEPRTRADWITGDRERLDAYVSDPLCSFMFTVNAYYHLFDGMLVAQDKKSVFLVPKTLPLLFAAGADDPVGSYGKGVRRIYEKYKKAGMQDAAIRIYPEARHELLNETNRKQVTEDLLTWIKARM